MMKTIVHLSNDYPDPLIPDKTRAIQSLVAGTPEFRHIVYSLNRVDGRAGIATLPFGDGHTAMAYAALPKGVFWESRLRAVGLWIEQDLRRRNIQPDLIEAHKFTVEAIAGEYLADAFKCPLVCDIQGGTDERILRKSPHRRARYHRLAQRTALFFPFAPWCIAPLHAMGGVDPAKCTVLPVVPGVNDLSPAPVTGGSRLLSVFHLNSWKRKNIAGMIAAVAALARTRPDISLDIYGGGAPASLMAVTGMIEKAGMVGRIGLKGPAPNGELPRIMKDYACLVLPTFEESYGLVYAEALFAGLPLLFSKNRGVDGFFDTNDIGYACDPGNDGDIAAGMLYLLDNEADLKRRIASLQETGRLDIMRRDSILDTYRNGLMGVLSANQNK